MNKEQTEELLREVLTYLVCVTQHCQTRGQIGEIKLPGPYTITGKVRRALEG